MLKEINNLNEFKQSLSVSNFAVIGFYSPTCVECKKLAPLFKEGAEKYSLVNFLRVNFSEVQNRDIVKENKIFSPTLMLYKNGKEYKRFAVEVIPLSEIKEEFLSFLKSSE